MIEETGRIGKAERASIARKITKPSILRERMELLAVGHGLTIKGESDMLKEKKKAKNVATHIISSGKRFSIRWGNDAKTEVRVVRVK